MKTNEKGSKLFRLFDYNRDNRLDAVEEDTTPTLKRYFKLLGRKFWKLISLNLMMLPMILPILIAVYVYLGFEKTPIGNDVLFSQLYGANLIQPSAHSTVLLDLFGAQLNIPVFNNTLSYIWIALALAFLLITFGWQNVGASYILRSMVRGEPVFMFSDYFYAIKRNLKQGFLLGVIDALVIFFLGFDIMYFQSAPSSFWTDFCFFTTCAIAILYFFVRFYMYLMLVTFNISIRKIFKNSLIFSILGIKRNLLAVLGIVVITSINIVLFPVFAITPLGIAIPLLLPFLYYLGVTSFTTAYAAYPVIERYMIEPFAKPVDENELEDESEDESKNT